MNNDEFLTILMSDGNNWFTSIDTVSLEKKNYSKKKEDIIYTIFDEASELVDDEFWKVILKNASVNKFKRGFKFKNGILTYKSKNTIISHSLCIDSPKDVMESFIYFMRDNCGVYSETDKQIKHTGIINSLISDKPNAINSWSKIKTYIQKTMIINKYISTFKNLTIAQTKQLKHKITIGIISGFFNTKTIIVEDSEIINIIGLEKNSHGIYYINKELINITHKEYKDKVEESTDTIDGNQQIITPSKFTYSKCIIDFFDKINKYKEKD